MKKIYDQSKNIRKILPIQEVNKEKKYRKSEYIVEHIIDGGVAILNTATYEYVFLSNNEISYFESSNDLNNEITKYLIEHYFLVPFDFDDKKFANQIYDVLQSIERIYIKQPYDFFCILTTTGCNARCFYCFEKGAHISTMTEKTAHDVAKYIFENGKKRVKLQWFGGEPLVNIKAIDIISDDLTKYGVDYDCYIVSNGYLFDDEIVKKAKNDWKLKDVQITLDGTEKVYNRIKNYVYKDKTSPFLRVVNNIETLLEAGIQVNIRLNMDDHNEDDLFELSKFLVKRFNKYKNCYIYVVRLFEDTCSRITNRETNRRHEIIEKSIKLQNYIRNNMPKTYTGKLPKSHEPGKCMACSDNAVMIVPDGHLGKCEHFIDSEFFGSIYSDKINLEKINQFKERVFCCSNCRNCKYILICSQLEKCSGKTFHCDEFDKHALETRLIGKLENIYYKFIEDEDE